MADIGGYADVRPVVHGSTLDHDERWFGAHLGVRFKVWRRECALKSHTGRSWDWAHYLIVPTEQLGVDAKKWTPRIAKIEGKRSHYVYYKSPWANLEWHGGITYFEIEGGRNFGRVMVPGCDYSHGFDDSIDYSLEWVVSEAHKTVESLWLAKPDMLVRCGWDGTYHSLSDMVAGPRPGIMYAKANVDALPEGWRAGVGGEPDLAVAVRSLSHKNGG